MNFQKKIFIILSCIFSNFLVFLLLKPLLYSTSIIFPYTIPPLDICITFPNVWKFIKILYFIFSFFSFYLFFNSLASITFTSPITSSNPIFPTNSNNLQLFIGNNSETKTPIYLSEKSLYQNICITGSIGSGKTSSSMYPFAKQLISYHSTDETKKLSILILDTKGNFYSHIYPYIKAAHREDDVIPISLSSSETYNPLDKPNLKPLILANRLKTILTLFSPNNSESYWLDKVETILAEAIKFCRFYNNGYVTFAEIHKIITEPEYFSEKVSFLRSSFQKDFFNASSCYDLLNCISFFQKEFFSLDERTLSILKSEVTRITSLFVSDYSVFKTFCPSQSSITFHGFKEILEKGKIVVLQMNIFEYKNLSKLIATYLKLDFQSEIMQSLSNDSFSRTSCFLCDEYHEYATISDSDFFAQSREAKCINIIATQSYTSLLNSLNNENATKVILQNLVNKIWYRTDDLFTIESAQKQLGKEEKEKISKTISENAKETSYNYLLHSLQSQNSNISESINKYSQTDFIYDTNFFTQHLNTFSSLVFLSTGDKMLPPQKLNMIPYFKKN